jgi:hypothetical protein
MDKRKNYRYVVLDLGSNISGDLFSTTPSTLSLEVQRPESNQPYSHYSVKKVIPCTFKQGKLHKL